MACTCEKGDLSASYSYGRHDHGRRARAWHVAASGRDARPHRSTGGVDGREEGLAQPPPHLLGAAPPVGLTP